MCFALFNTLRKRESEIEVENKKPTGYGFLILLYYLKSQNMFEHIQSKSQKKT